ncbi:MAG: hypothetical protein K5882_00340 [Bacteroidales bacterium]|nr:hypothetical protein [Bacteroidales bacterium]
MLKLHEAFVTKTLQEVAASNSVHSSETTSPQPQGEIAKILQKYISDNNNKENNQPTNENKTMNKKQVIRINENQLRQIVAESVKRALKEGKVVALSPVIFRYVKTNSG